MFSVPRSMSTQYPDNALMPFFVSSSLLEGEDEIQKAFYAFSNLGCQEQMWDFEGKVVDSFVVKKAFWQNSKTFLQKKLKQKNSIKTKL
ncbi:MAG: phosphoenolpyruvate carboxylase [Candidatus Diapherotrites archaeon]|nr:phosphoenolpyruvate carboxylase [Candidatus Diapherotrites archaeon]